MATVKNYLDLNKMHIANARGWDCKRNGCPGDCRLTCKDYDSENGIDCRQHCKRSCLYNCKEECRMEFCPRMRETCRFVDLLDSYLCMDMGDVTVSDVNFALEQIGKERNYSEITIRGIQSCISVIFRFAENHDDFYNIMKRAYCVGSTRSIFTILRSGNKKQVIQYELQQELDKYRHLTKSLSVKQQERLTHTLWTAIEEDGRYCLIALMLYAGVRPAEGRGLLWKDLVPFLDHPDRWIINVYKIRDKNGVLKAYAKTSNAFRRIPVHCELMALLKKRRDYVLKRSEGKDISDLPVCCFGNDFSRPCRDYEASWLADKVFSNNLKLKLKDLYVFMLEAEIEKLSGNAILADEDQQLTLYVLRRAFWTWCMSLTTLTDFEKRYIMGHDMKEDMHSVRSQYNDENYLWLICQKMDRCILGAPLHESFLSVNLEQTPLVQIDNRGVLQIRLTKEMLAKGGTLIGSITTEETGEPISLTALSPVRGSGLRISQVDILPILARTELPSGINCEYENRLAHLMYAKSDGEDTPEDPTEP